jgi:hypothetical protein
LSLTQSFRQHCGLGVDSASNRKEYQEYFLEGVKAAGSVRLTTLPSSLTTCHEIWEPPAPGRLGVQPGGFKRFSRRMKRLLMRFPPTPSVSPNHHPTIAPYQPDHPAQCVTQCNQYISKNPTSGWSHFQEGRCKAFSSLKNFTV